VADAAGLEQPERRLAGLKQPSAAAATSEAVANQLRRREAPGRPKRSSRRSGPTIAIPGHRAVSYRRRGIEMSVMRSQQAVGASTESERHARGGGTNAKTANSDSISTHSRAPAPSSGEDDTLLLTPAEVGLTSTHKANASPPISHRPLRVAAATDGAHYHPNAPLATRTIFDTGTKL